MVLSEDLGAFGPEKPLLNSLRLDIPTKYFNALDDFNLAVRSYFEENTVVC